MSIVPSLFNSVLKQNLIMSFTIEAPKPVSSRNSYETVAIADSTLTIKTPYSSADFTGSIGLRPASDPCGGCNGVLVLFFVEGVLEGAYWVNGRSILPIDSIDLQQREYLVDYMVGKDLYYAAAQYSGNCGGCGCGCDSCQKIWTVDSTTTTWDALAETEADVPGYEEAIPLAFAAAKLKSVTSSSAGCEPDFLDLNNDICY